ncbi:MAG: hypothetical protein ABW208_19335, partial [Pyrinomonadaceae bacterium]
CARLAEAFPKRSSAVPHFTVRAAAAAFAFILGLAAVWLSGLTLKREAAVAEWLVPASDISVPAVRVAEDDAQQVYRTVLQEMFGGDDAWRLLVIRAETLDCSFRDEETGVTEFGGLASETVSNYNAVRGLPKRLPVLPGIKARLALLESCEYASMFKGREPDGRANFNQKFPGSSGYIQLSAIGFNRTGDQAFLYVARNCGWLCGDGWHVLLRKTARGWEVESKQMNWVS